MNCRPRVNKKINISAVCKVAMDAGIVYYIVIGTSNSNPDSHQYATQMTQIENISARTLQDWLAEDSVILVDVREIEEYESAHIAGALLIPLSYLDPGNLPVNPDKKLVFYCKSGKRSAYACLLCSQQFSHEAVYNLDGGLDGWMDAGLEYKTLEK